jgi:hypothetical protein
MVALNRDQTTAQPRMALERSAQLLYPRIRPARNHYVSNSHLENLTLSADHAVLALNPRRSVVATP